MAKDALKTVEQLAVRLETALGRNLVSLMLYGSTARHQESASRSDINLLLIVRDASTRALNAATGPLAQWIAGGETPPLIFSEEEWRASADVFPIEIEDMRDARKVIRGDDPLTGLETDPRQLRQQLEREIRGKLLHLRTEYASVAGDPKALARLLENSASTFLVFFRATVRLKGGTPSGDAGAVVREAAVAAGFDPAPFLWALAARQGRPPSPLKALDPLGAQYVDAVEQLARVVNSL